MKRLEPKAPRLMRDRAAFVSAAPGLLMPVLVLSLAFWAILGTASAAEPQPDAAPQAPAVAPDPAPEARNTTPPQQSTPAPPTQVAPQAPAVTQQPSVPAATPSTTTQRQTSPKPKVESKPARVRRETPASRPERADRAGGPESVGAGRLIPPGRAGRRGLAVAPRAARSSSPAGAADGKRLADIRGHARVGRAAAVKWLVLAVAATLALAGVAQAMPPSLTYDCDPSPDDCAGWFRLRLSWSGLGHNSQPTRAMGTATSRPSPPTPRERTSTARSRMRRAGTSRVAPSPSASTAPPRRSPARVSADRRIATTGSTIRSRSNSPARTQRSGIELLHGRHLRRLGRRRRQHLRKLP